MVRRAVELYTTYDLSYLWSTKHIFENLVMEEMQTIITIMTIFD